LLSQHDLSAIPRAGDKTGTAAGRSQGIGIPPIGVRRASIILRDLGWIEIKDSNPVGVTELDVSENQSGIKIAP
jgi:D-methionine transport system substrate-binding protein